MKNLVSIIIPAYNAEKTINQCLSSLQSQTYKEIEILVVNDCSKDKTSQIVTEIAKTDERIKLFNQPSNMGVSMARNRGISEAKGEFICFVDSDDWCEKDYVESMLKLFDKDVCMVSCGFKYEKRNEKTFSNKHIKTTIYDTTDFSKIFSDKYSFVLCCNKLFRASLIHQQQFDTSISTGEDLISWISFLEANPSQKAVHTSKKLYHYIKTKGSASGLTTTKEKFVKHIKVIEQFEEIKKQTNNKNLVELINSWTFLLSLQFAYQSSKLKMKEQTKYFKQLAKTNYKDYKKMKHIYSSFRRCGGLLYYIIKIFVH